MNLQFDNSHSHIGFSVKHMMIATVRGEFMRYFGSLELGTEDLTRPRISGEIEVASLDTREENVTIIFARRTSSTPQRTPRSRSKAAGWGAIATR